MIICTHLRYCIDITYVTWCTFNNISTDTDGHSCCVNCNLGVSMSALCHNTMLHDITWQQWERPNTDHTSNLRKTPRTGIVDLLWVFGNKALCFTVLQYLNDWPLHDDVIKWKHFPRYWTFVQGIRRSPVNYPHEGQWRGALMFSLICARINGWVNNREAGDMRRHRAHHDVIVTLNTWCGILLRVTS